MQCDAEETAAGSRCAETVWRLQICAKTTFMTVENSLSVDCINLRLNNYSVSFVQSVRGKSKFSFEFSERS